MEANQNIEDELDSSNLSNEGHLVKERLAKVENLKKSGQNPYPLRFKATHSIPEVVGKYKDATAEGDLSNEISLAGRLTSLRDLGKMVFCDLSSGGEKLQIQLKKDNLGEGYAVIKDIDLGDFIGVLGKVFKTRRGELTLAVDRVEILSKSLRPLPDKWAGLKDPEERRRRRYLDLVANKDSFLVAKKRSKTVSLARDFMNKSNFLEFETPILNPVAAGAMAKPFKTHHNALGRDWFLRIATELPLKKLMVGGFERVYELGRVFRNEGIDKSHNPEFTTIEGYWAYASYIEIMELIENMCAFIALEVNGTTKINSFDNKGQIDLKPPWKRLSLREEILKRSGIDFLELKDRDALAKAMLDQGIKADYSASWGKLLEKVVSSRVEPHLREPTFLVDYPTQTTPFAKEKKEGIVERAEGFVLGTELVNIFTELNDPILQKERLFEQENLSKLHGDDEMDRVDEDFILAVEHGMPPAGGFGIGIDRLAMLIAGTESIRDILLFPSLKNT